MKTIFYSTQFKKDAKRYRHQTDKINKILALLRLLQQELPLPPACKAHKLKGDYRGCWECHVENDFLLIWIDEATNSITALRMGTHAELFR